MSYNEIIIVYQTSENGLSIPNSWECRDESQQPFMDPIWKCLNRAGEESSKTRTLV